VPTAAVAARSAALLWAKITKAGLLITLRIAFSNSSTAGASQRGVAPSAQAYEQQGDWHQAGDHQRLSEFTSPEHPTALAHYCANCRTGWRDGQARADEWLNSFAVQHHFWGVYPAPGFLWRMPIRAAALLCKRVIELHPHLLPIALPGISPATRRTWTMR
jgi:hypothetical protein